MQYGCYCMATQHYDEPALYILYKVSANSNIKIIIINICAS